MEQVARKRIRRKPGNRVKIALHRPSSTSSTSSPGHKLLRHHQVEGKGQSSPLASSIGMEQVEQQIVVPASFALNEINQHCPCACHKQVPNEEQTKLDHWIRRRRRRRRRKSSSDQVVAAGSDADHYLGPKVETFAQQQLIGNRNKPQVFEDANQNGIKLEKLLNDNRNNNGQSDDESEKRCKTGTAGSERDNQILGADDCGNRSGYNKSYNTNFTGNCLCNDIDEAGNRIKQSIGKQINEHEPAAPLDGCNCHEICENNDPTNNDCATCRRCFWRSKQNNTTNTTTTTNSITRKTSISSTQSSSNSEAPEVQSISCSSSILDCQVEATIATRRQQHGQLVSLQEAARSELRDDVCHVVSEAGVGVGAGGELKGNSRDCSECCWPEEDKERPSRAQRVQLADGGKKLEATLTSSSDDRQVEGSKGKDISFRREATQTIETKSSSSELLESKAKLNNLRPVESRVFIDGDNDESCRSHDDEVKIELVAPSNDGDMRKVSLGRRRGHFAMMMNNHISSLVRQPIAFISSLISKTKSNSTVSEEKSCATLLVNSKGHSKLVVTCKLCGCMVKTGTGNESEARSKLLEDGGLAIAATTASIAVTTVNQPGANTVHLLHQQSTTTEGIESRREKKAAKTLAIITGVFVMCWLPFFMMAIAMPLLNLKPHKYVFAVLLWLGYINSMLNPIIYTIFSPDFRKAFKRLLCGTVDSFSERRLRQEQQQQQQQYSTNNANNQANSKWLSGDHFNLSCCLPFVSKTSFSDNKGLNDNSLQKNNLVADNRNQNNIHKLTSATDEKEFSMKTTPTSISSNYRNTLGMNSVDKNEAINTSGRPLSNIRNDF